MVVLNVYSVKMAVEMKLNITPFDGQNYLNWEFRVKLAMEQAAVINVLEEPCPGTDVKTRNIMVQSLADNMLVLIKVEPQLKTY